ncbi:carbohydrate ABC transporter permease [Cohnella sp.]|uniref:carbohydrate ABC transporter permease n=1 Tax=Cohnella sp. TaxID=1883426 RepID=UPI0035671DA0
MDHPVTGMSDSRKSKPKTRWYVIHKLRDNVIGYLFISPIFIVFGVFSLFPILWSLYISFFKWNIIGGRQFIGLKNYEGLFTNDPLFWKSVGILVLFG